MLTPITDCVPCYRQQVQWGKDNYSNARPQGHILFSFLDESGASSHPRTLHLMYNNYERCAAAKHCEQRGACYN